ncbi:SEC-C metal-binding domain-containing protein [Variovorax sp. J22R133]|uniref:SEC-C metal-binding domain-containing protein n=1 Tax=Variovorax brevis TaxID=3053503 RepID=UPI002575ADC4|nr:SEC-C metal-binding domain-containing protein [Variovorax sp. J22R133]MDM0116001.1 SEC-C metal-binding domain-containing protein [Variovorax sp. J22R133]
MRFPQRTGRPKLQALVSAGRADTAKCQRFADDLNLASISGAPTSGNSRPQHKVRRNEPCPCGSGKKFKKCCGERLNCTETDRRSSRSVTA